MGVQNYIAFLAATAVFTVMPGIDSVFVLNNALSSGFKSTLRVITGISAGNLIHLAVAAFGVSAVVTASPAAYQIIKYAGAAYMVWLGIKCFIPCAKDRMKDGNPAQSNVPTISNGFYAGFITNLLNPKIPLFFVSFIPQFITPGYGSSPVPFFILGLTLITMGCVWFLIISAFAGYFSSGFVANQGRKRIMDIISGSVFFLLALAVVIIR